MRNVSVVVMPRRSGLQICLMAACCLLLAGCVTRSDSDAGASFHYEWWLPLSVLVAGVAFVPIGLGLRKQSERLGWGLIIAGPLAVLMFAPSLFLERTLVSDQGFEVRSGIWGMTANQKVDFNAVRSLRIAEEETGGRRSRQIEVLYFDLLSGPAARLPLNNDVKIEAAKEIVTRLTQRGVPLAD